MAKTAEVTMEVKEVVGVISQHGNNSLELRLVSWNGADPKYDLRNWYLDREGNEKCAKGLTFAKEDLEQLKELLNSITL